MANALFSFEAFHSNGDQAVHFPGFGKAGEAIKAKEDHFCGIADWGGINYLFSDYNFNQDVSVNNRVLISEDLVIPDGMHSDLVYMEIQSLPEPTKFNAGPGCHLENSQVDDTMELVELKVIKAVYPISSATLELLKSYRTGYKRSNGEKITESSNEVICPIRARGLSTEDVMRVAGARYIQLSDHVEDDISMLVYPSVSMLSMLTDEEC